MADAGNLAAGEQQPAATGRSATEPRRGRQAEAARNDMIVLAAAREVFAAMGAQAPVSAVAERAGVGIGSLYRRYGSKDDLLRHLCMLAMRQSIAAAEEALGAADAWDGLTGYIRSAVAQGTGSLAPLAGAIQTTPEMWETSRRGRELLGLLVARAQAAGALRADATPLDIAHLIEMFGRLGPVAPGTEEHGIRLRLLAIAVDGLRAAQASGSLPGSPPSTAHYEGRWVPRPSGSAP
jgi:AcrR family transcriptional regulator